MSDPADFLARWSRRKRAAAEGRVDAGETPAPEQTALEAGAAPVTPEAEPDAASAADPSFDISKLPSLDSIGPDTDVRLFLQPGVPASLRHAALRRAWVSDPAIRDFRAPQEMDWDFNAPGVPGFGEIGPELDVQRLAARLLGDEPPSAPEQAEPASVQQQHTIPPAQGAEERARDGDQPAVRGIEAKSTEPREIARLQRSENAAAQKESLAHAVSASRRHGGALPK